MKKLYILFFCYILNTNAQTVSTLAGSTNGYVDGIGTNAKFLGPSGVDVDPDGNIIVADRVNHRIRKVTPSGVVTTIAGSVEGFADGPGASALFSYPMNLTVDNSGVIYVTDSFNHRIRKIMPDGTVSTLAGSAPGYVDGTVSNALFDYPEGIFAAPNGIIYVTDSSNHCIRKIMPDGTVTTLAGGTIGNADGIGTAAQFWNPCGIVVDSNGTAYVTEKHHRIRKITDTGVVTTFVGNGTSGYLDGVGTAARVNAPFDITMDSSGILYIADSSNNRIRKIMPDGTISTFAGSTQGSIDGVGTAAKFYYPIGICLSNSGELFIGESGGGKIRKITTTLGASNFTLDDKITIYPNPTSGLINLDVEDLTDIEISILDMNGRILKHENHVINTTVIDISNLTNGIYLFQLTSNNETFTKKILKN